MSKKASYCLLAICSVQFIIGLTYAGFVDMEVFKNKKATEIYPYGNFSKYTPNKVYPQEPSYPTTTVDFVGKLSHLIFDTFIKDASGLPSGYIKKLAGSGTLTLGPNIEMNEWRDLLEHYWGFLLCVIVLLFLIIVSPFVAVWYYCFKIYRCSSGCPRCDWRRDSRQRCVYGFLLAVLLICILFGAIIVFQDSNMLRRGLAETSGVTTRSTQTYCTFLKDVSSHVNHLFKNNYEELAVHLDKVIHEIQTYFYEALFNCHGKTIWEANNSRFRVNDNIFPASKLMYEVDVWQRDLVFLGGQLRDGYGLRSVERDIIYACTVLCGNAECLRFLKTSNIHELDSSKCLHFDMLPDSKFWADAMVECDNKKYFNHLKNFNSLFKRDPYKNGVKMLYDPLMEHVNKGKEYFRVQGDNIRNLIDEVASELHSRSIKSIGSFDDISGKYDTHRNLVNSLIGSIFLIIIFIFAVGLIFGFCGRLRRGSKDIFCSQISGAKCLYMGIMLIFCVFSFVILVGLFYMILGLITFMGVCAPLRDSDGKSMMRQLDSLIDLSRFQSRADPEPETQLPHMRLSKAITQCGANQTIIQVLQDVGLFDLDSLFNIKVFVDIPIPETPYFGTWDYKGFHTGHVDSEIWSSTLANYTGTMYTDYLCTDVTPIELPALITQLKNLRSSLWTQWGVYDWARISLYDNIVALEEYQDKFYFKVIDLITKITDNILKIDQLILLDRKPFGESMKQLDKIEAGRESATNQLAGDILKVWRKNIPEHLEDQIKEYIKMVIKESKANVGNCAPIAKTYSTTVENICHRIVDPLNGLTFGVLVGGLLLLPALFLAHRLMCLYRKIYPRQQMTVEYEYDCPTCSGGATKPPLHDFGEDDPSQCACIEVFDNRYEGGTAMGEQQTSLEVIVHEEPCTSANSIRKKD